jgi:hypothetical protein
MFTISSYKGNANQNHTKFHLTPVRIAIITPPSKKHFTQKQDEDWNTAANLLSSMTHGLF